MIVVELPGRCRKARIRDIIRATGLGNAPLSASTFEARYFSYTGTSFPFSSMSLTEPSFQSSSVNVLGSVFLVSIMAPAPEVMTMRLRPELHVTVGFRCKISWLGYHFPRARNSITYPCLRAVFKRFRVPSTAGLMISGRRVEREVNV
jgi:hypothetical protein